MARLQAPAHAAVESGARSASQREVVRTTCGREFAIGHLRLEQVAYPASRVTLSTACLPDDRGGIWASLSPFEARRLAALLLAHADATEPEPGDAKQVRVDYADADRYIVRIPGRYPAVNTRESTFGADGAAVTDLLAAAVALDLARRAGQFLARHETRRDELHVTAHIGTAQEHAARRQVVAATVTTPPSLTSERKSALRTLLRTGVLRNPAWRGLQIEIAIA